MLQPGNDVGAGEIVGFGPQHQVAGAQAQAAVVDQQVAHLQVRGDPRIVHAQLRQVPDHRIVPAQAALVDQPRQHRGGHRLGIGGDLEQCVGRDRLAAAGGQFAAGLHRHHPTVLDHTHGQPGQIVMFERLVDQRGDRVAIGLRHRCSPRGRHVRLSPGRRPCGCRNLEQGRGRQRGRPWQGHAHRGTVPVVAAPALWRGGGAGRDASMGMDAPRPDRPVRSSRSAPVAPNAATASACRCRTGPGSRPGPSRSGHAR